MALIICPECGRQVSDNAVSCPGCGCPVTDMELDSRSELDKLVDEVWKLHPYSKTDCIRGLQKNGVNLKIAKSIIDQKFESDQVKQVLRQKKHLTKKNLGRTLRIFVMLVRLYRILSETQKLPVAPNAILPVYPIKVR